jgi:hypothetical protein
MSDAFCYTGLTTILKTTQTNTGVANQREDADRASGSALPPTSTPSVQSSTIQDQISEITRGCTNIIEGYRSGRYTKNYVNCSIATIITSSQLISVSYKQQSLSTYFRLLEEAGHDDASPTRGHLQSITPPFEDASEPELDRHSTANYEV